MISLLLTLTPGSVVMEVNGGRKVSYAFTAWMSNSQKRGDFDPTLKNFEKAIMEVTR